MFCKNCGSQIDDRAAVCPHCGVPTGVSQGKSEGVNVLAIIGFIFSFFIALVGLICSILGYKKAGEYSNGGQKGLALAGIIISAISMGLAFILMVSIL